MAISWIQPSFAGGEIGPSLYGRIDMAKYQVALRKCDNFIVRQYGGVENRPGTRFVGAAKYANRKCRLIPFQFSTVQTYALEFGHQYMRVIKDGALVLNSSMLISSMRGLMAPKSRISSTSNISSALSQLSFIYATSFLCFVNGVTCFPPLLPGWKRLYLSAR